MMLLLLLLLLGMLTGSVRGQCNGRPLYLTAANSTGYVAFPEVNWDAEANAWRHYQFYPTSVKCTWVVKAPPSHVLTATFLHFDTEQDYDFVTLYGSEERLEQLLRVSGDYMEEYVTSPEDTLVIDFISDDYTTYYGFLLAYQYEPQACMGNGVTVAEEHLIALPPTNLVGTLPGPRLEKGGQVVRSKGGAGGRIVNKEEEAAAQGKGEEGSGLRWVPRVQYGPWVNCTWRIAVDQRNLVVLTMLHFDTGPRDVIKILQLGGGGEWRPLLHYGGPDVPRRVFQSTRPLAVNFVSGAKDHGTGFLLDVAYIRRACEPGPQELGAPRGVVAYPRHNLVDGAWRGEGLVHYGPDTCEWLIRAPPGYAVNITILQFDTRPKDKLEFLEGGSVSLSHGGGMPSQPTFLSRASAVAVRFAADQDTGKTGFLLQYSWVLRDCEWELSGERGELRSPFYPDVYGPNVTCRWTITPQPRHLVHVLVARLTLDAGDTLQVSDGRQDLKVSGASAGRLLELQPSPTATLFFSSDNHHNRGFFLLKYTTFLEGSCDFTLSPCGWRSLDLLQAWAFQGSSGRMGVSEAGGLHHPRGYRAVLASPVVNPRAGDIGEEGVAMCLRLDYVLDGPDAFLLTATLLEEEGEGEGERSVVENPLLDPLLSLYGPHGNMTVTAAKNFTARGPFKIRLTYERGYGPHYEVGVMGVGVTVGACGAELDALTNTSCTFQGRLCGWTNTHTDQRNWLLKDTGVAAEVRGVAGVATKPRGKKPAKPFASSLSATSSSMDTSQWADLLSPTLTRTDLGGDAEGACLTLRYRIMSEHSELRVVLKGVREGMHRVEGARQEEREEVLLWSQGRVMSQGVLEGLVDIPASRVPPKAKLVLRAVGVGEGAGGVEVVGVNVTRGRCSSDPSCSFDSGFCSWRVSNSGRTVWYIKPHELSQDDDGGEGGSSHAVVLGEGRPGDTTSLTSLPLDPPGPTSLSFRYRLVGTSQCLTVGREAVGGGAREVVWAQCRGKGDHWLHECVDLKPFTQPFQITVTAGTGERRSQVWLDEVQVWPWACNVTTAQSAPAPSLSSPPQWQCEPRGSLCGLTQPQPAHRDWVYVHVTSATNKNFNTTTTPVPWTPTPLPPSDYSRDLQAPPQVPATPRPAFRACRDGVVVDAAWFCDGIPDCHDHSDEDDCDCEGEGCVGSRAAPSQHLGEGVCTGGAFKCPSGRKCEGGERCDPCLARSLLCDGAWDCQGGEDEGELCAGVVSRHANPTAVSGGGGDGGAGPGVTCSGGLVIPSAWLCDGKKDCPHDGLDEVGCGYCTKDEYLCPTSGVCVPRAQVCDGTPSLPGCTDEQHCFTCPPAHLACGTVCVASWQVCDGTWDCEDGRDEHECGGFRGPEDECGSGHYRCPAGRCLDTQAVCDRHDDCQDGEDEHQCADDNTQVSRYISVRASPVSILGGAKASGAQGGYQDLARAPSRLVTPVLHHPKGGVGVLTFKYRLDGWLGASNTFLSVEVVRADNPDEGVVPWALWRQSGHKGRHWLNAEVVIPSIPDTSHYKLSVVVSADARAHSSQQVHVAQLAYSVVQPEALTALGPRQVCGFSGGLCGWSQPATQDGYAWLHAHASPHTRRTGPITGYPDGGNSGFLLADSLYGSEGSTADLLSPPLTLPQGADPAICFKFWTFLYGAHVARVSVHVLQHVGDKTHTAEVYQHVGGVGLSWVPVSVTVGVADVLDPLAPLVLVMRATRGSGPESDIALDQVSIAAGSCSSASPDVDSSLALNTILKHPEALALSAGPAVTPMSSGKQVKSQQGTCGRVTSCSECVGDVTCVWCDASQTCDDVGSTAANACPRHLTVHHNASSEMRRGEEWCPQLIPRQESEVLVAAGSSPVLSFAVHNIQVTQTNRPWTCMFEPLLNPEFATSDPQEVKKEENDAGNKGSSKVVGGEVKDGEEAKNKPEEEEQTLTLQGHFQGRIFEVGGGVNTGVGVGSIRCGDGVERLHPLTTDPSHADIPTAAGGPSQPSDGPAQSHYAVKLVSPSGAVLDNPGGVKVVVYRCEQFVDSCLGCVTLNASLACGWCQASSACTVHDHCLGSIWYGPGRSCEDSEEALEEEGEESVPEDLVGDALAAHSPEVKEFAKDDFDFDGHENLLDSPTHEDQRDHNEEEEEERKTRRIKQERKRNKKKRKNTRMLDNAVDEMEEDEEEEIYDQDDEDRTVPTKRSGRNNIKGNLKMGGRGRSFLRLPHHPGLYVARDAWRLHTGRQYYVPVTKKTLINLGFVRQVTYGNLAQERSRTVLVNGAWKKASGYFVDLFEKSGQDPVTSVITTSRSVFDQLLAQLTPQET